MVASRPAADTPAMGWILTHSPVRAAGCSVSKDVTVTVCLIRFVTSSCLLSEPTCTRFRSGGARVAAWRRLGSSFCHSTLAGTAQVQCMHLQAGASTTAAAAGPGPGLGPGLGPPLDVINPGLSVTAIRPFSGCRFLLPCNAQNVPSHVNSTSANLELTSILIATHQPACVLLASCPPATESQSSTTSPHPIRLCAPFATQPALFTIHRDCSPSISNSYSRSFPPPPPRRVFQRPQLKSATEPHHTSASCHVSDAQLSPFYARGPA